MKLDPRTWLRRNDKPEAAYLKKICVITNCLGCPHSITEDVDLGQATDPVCGVVKEVIRNPSVRPDWCPLSTIVPSPDDTVVWEGDVCLEG